MAFGLYTGLSSQSQEAFNLPTVITGGTWTIHEENSLGYSVSTEHEDEICSSLFGCS